LSGINGDNFAWEYHELEAHGKSEVRNEYLTRFILDLETRERAFQCLVTPTDAGLASMRTWFRSAHGGSLPSLFWPDPNVNDALFGTWGTSLDVLNQLTNYRPFTLTFSELSKGIPLL
jgi:hypothetical protein